MMPGQGKHLDPLDAATQPPDPAARSVWERAAIESRAMGAFREALTLDGRDGIRAAVLDDLSTYFHLTEDECVRRCVDWEQWSVAEWQATERNTTEEITDFYRTLQSWSFDLLWHAYLQAEGHTYPVSVVVAHSLPSGPLEKRHLDFGSGVGVTSQLFAGLGYETDLADISTPLLAFARYRLERRGAHAAYIDLNESGLAEGRYDVITAIDTLAHVPSVAATALLLHRALKPDGLLFTNFDVRPKAPENAWHLYDDDLPLRWQLQRAGFEPFVNFDGVIAGYRRVEPRGSAHTARGLRDLLLLRSPLRPAYRRVRDALRRGGVR